MAPCQDDASPPHTRQPSQTAHPSPSQAPLIDLVCALALTLTRALGDEDRLRRIMLGELDLTPARLAPLLSGVSLVLMLIGSTTFLAGLLLMPWVLGLIAALYVAGVVRGVSSAARAVVSAALGSAESCSGSSCCATEDLSPGQLFTRFPII